MSTKLQRHKLSSLIDVKRGQSISGEYYASEGDYIRLTLANFDYINGGFKKDNQKNDLFYTGPVKPECLLNEGDIITPLTEQALGLLGSTARIPESGKYVQSGDIALVTCKEGLLDPNFCYYLLPSKQVKKQLAAGSQQTKIRHTSPDAIKACVVDIPDYEQQKRIGGFLSLLDRKIALNSSINNNLEALAKQIYGYWFVQFDFPDENGRPYKSSGGKMVWNDRLKREIPKGWKVLPLFDAADVQYGFPFSTDLFTEEETDIPIVRIRDILGGTISAYSNETPDEKYHLQKFDVIIGMDGNFHMNFWHDNSAYLNQRCVRIRPNTESIISSIQIYYDLKPYIKAKESNIQGSTVGHLSDKDLKGLYLLCPVANKFFQPKMVFDHLLSLQIHNRQQIISLTKQRNELLPLLMNGQVTIE